MTVKACGKSMSTGNYFRDARLTVALSKVQS